MDRNLIEKYIDSFDKKIVSVLDLDKCKIEYSGIKAGRDIRDIPGDEEMSRAFLLTRLVNELGYPAERIEILFPQINLAKNHAAYLV